VEAAVTDYVWPQARLIVSDRETQLDDRVGLAVGDTVEVVRGNGPREGERMGTATVTGFEDGSPVLAFSATLR
jgi:hypothetical protein